MDIEKLRARIDRLDARILDLLNHRMRAAQQIGRLKRADGRVVYAPQREAAVLRRLARANRGPLSREALRSIYTEIISACRASEKRLRIAFLGPEGTFSHQAVLRHFGSCVDPAPFGDISRVFTEVEAGHADYGVAPVENSTEGGVGATLNGLMESDLKICAEVYMRIHHNLLARSAASRIRRIYSKAEVFGQCQAWLAANYPHAETVETASTVQAAERAASEPGSAAIAHMDVARRLRLKAIHRAIEDSPFNMTRFLVLSHSLVPPSGHDKTSILCFVRDEIGALVNILSPFKRQRISLTKVESWPSRRKPWDYCFFIDFMGSYEDPPVAKALQGVAQRSKEMKLLGSYPAASLS
jgi:chorismate mutase/prephenate dehydratase